MEVDSSKQCSLRNPGSSVTEQQAGNNPEKKTLLSSLAVSHQKYPMISLSLEKKIEVAKECTQEKKNTEDLCQ